MQYHIQTTPVWDAFRKKDGCPICLLYERIENRLVKQYLGEAVMEPDYRIKVNKRGFCTRHLLKLYDGGNKLGLALQLNTRTENVIENIPSVSNAKQAKKLAEKLEAEAAAMLKEKQDAYPDSFDGKTIIIECARGGPDGASRKIYKTLRLQQFG